MEIIGCGKGHFYNPELYSSCPECAKANGGSDYLGATEPVDFGNYANNFDSVGATEPVGFGGFAGGSDVGKTEPMGLGGFAGGGSNDIGKTEPMGLGGFVGGNGGGSYAGGGAGSFDGMMSTTDFRGDFSDGGSNGGGKVQDYGATMPVPMKGAGPAGHGSVPFMPVVGWLVCIDGAAKGRDYRIHSQYNYIGRANHMDICISGDNCISAERAAVIAYDPKKRIFTFGPGMGHNIVYVNGEILMNAVLLKPYDQLTIGETELMFVPLCGERFDWNDK